MDHHDQYWKAFSSWKRLRRAMVISVLLHVALALAVSYYATRKNLDIQPIGYEVQLVQDAAQDAMSEPEPPAPEPPKPPTPEPPKPPEPEPPKVETPKPEPKPEPKIEPKKPEPKPEPKKPEPKKPEPKKPEPKKPEPKKPDPPKKEKAEKAKPTEGPKETGVAVQQQGLPSELSGWARAVKNKVERVWTQPAGLRLTDENQAWVAFWVDRDGNLLMEPEVIKEASDPELGQSGVRAIQLAAPLPPLPPDFHKLEQEVVYVFTLATE